MRSCCVPGCSVRDKLHRVPFPTVPKGKRWFKLCPFLWKYSLRQLENVRICRNHFINEHIDLEKGKLTEDAVPLLNLPPLPNKNKDKGTKFLEVSPIHPNVPANVKVLASETKSDRKRKERYLVYIKAEDSRGLPVDHSMYCLLFPENVRHACLFSPCVMCQTPTKELLSNNCTMVNKEAGQQQGTPGDHNEAGLQGTPGDHNVCYEAPQPGASAACSPVQHDHTADRLSPNVHHMQTESVAYVDAQLGNHMKEEVKRCVVSVATQTDDDSQQVSAQEMRAAEQLLGFPCIQNHNSMQNNVYVPPIATVVEDCVRTGNQQQTIYFSPNNFNLMISKSHQTLESVHALVSTAKEHHNVPLHHEPSQKSNYSTVNPCAELNKSLKLNFQPTVTNRISSVEQPLQSRPAQKRTLESLVAELTESVSAEQMTEVQPPSVVMAADTTVYLPNSTYDNAPHPPIVDPPTDGLHPLASNTKKKRFFINKENSTLLEQQLYKQLTLLRNELKRLKLSYKRLKSKVKLLNTKCKPYLKGYPVLTPLAKGLIDTQLRLAGIKPKAARYNEEEKLFALKLHQISPDCYRFLQQYMKLPTSTTMQAFMKIV